MDDLKIPQRIATAIVVALLFLILALVLLRHGSARGQALATPVQDCVRYLSVARDLHRLRLWFMDGQPTEGFDKIFLAWINIQSDATVRLAYENPTNARDWEEEWIRRYDICLKELGG